MTNYGRESGDDTETLEFHDQAQEEVDLDSDPFADDLSEQLQERAPRRIVTRTTIAFGILALLVAGFLSGAEVQKHWGRSSTQTEDNPFANLGAGSLPQMGASGFPGGGAFGGGNGTQTDNSQNSGSATGGATTGTVKLVDGDTVYIQTSDGRTVTINTSSSTSIEIPKNGSLKDLTAGSTVTVDGKAGSDGAVAANKITKTK